MKNPTIDELFGSFAEKKCIAAKQMHNPLGCSFEKIGNIEVCKVHKSFRLKK